MPLVREEWIKRYPGERIPNRTTCWLYCKKRLGFSYKLRKFEPDNRNSELNIRHRCKLLVDLYPRYSNPEIEVIWYDQKGFQKTDNSKKRWQFVGRDSHPRSDNSRIKNVTLQLAMTKNRVVGYQWVLGSVTNLDVFEFWYTIMTQFPIRVRNMRANGTIPQNLQDKDSILGWTVMMDNAAVHKHPSMLGFFNLHGLDVIYNTPYSPQLMPIEALFSLVNHYCNENRFTR